MSWVDIVIIALVVLLAGLGVLKGVKKSAVALGAFLVAFVISFFLAKVVAEAMLGIAGVKQFVLGSDGFSLFTWIRSMLGDAEEFTGYSPFIIDNFYNPVMDIIGQSNATLNIIDGRALYLAFVVFSAIVGVGLFIVIRLLLTIVTVIIKSYIGKKKSGLSRALGFFVGAVRGFAWAMAITIVFTSIGGFTTLNAFNTVEGEYEKSVIGKYVNDWSYTIRNKLYLPDADMYARIVDASGLTVDEGDKTPTDVTGARLDIYISLMNFNCMGDKYSKDLDDKLTVNTEVAEISPDTDFNDGGYANVIKSIMNYNATAAKGVWDKELLSGDVPATELGQYMDIIQYGSESIYNTWNDLLNEFRNYEVLIDDSRDITNASVIEAVNRDLKSRHDRINDKLETLSSQYAALATDFGAFPELTLPEVVVLSAEAA